MGHATKDFVKRPGPQAYQRGVDAAHEHKAKGNAAFAAGEWEEALRHWHNALGALKTLPDLRLDMDDPDIADKDSVKDFVKLQSHGVIQLRCSLHCNRAAAYLKQREYFDAVDECDEVLYTEVEEKPGGGKLPACADKALFRRAEAFRALECFEDALRDLERILMMQTSNKQVDRLVADIKRQMGDEEAAEQEAKEQAIDSREVGCANTSMLERFKDNVIVETASRWPGEPDFESRFVLLHAHTEKTGERIQTGQVEAPGAFEAPDALDSSLEQVRTMVRNNAASGEHEHCAAGAIVARKAKIQHPLLWFSGDWPFDDFELDGAFVEVHVRKPEAGVAPRRLFFVPVEEMDATHLHVPGTVELDVAEFGGGLLGDLKELFVERT